MQSSRAPVLAGYFFLLLIGWFIVLSVVLRALPQIWWEELAAIPVQYFFDLVGVASQKGFSDHVFLQFETVRIVISDVCTGVLELIVLSSAILATREIPWRRRLYGVLGGTIGVLVFNWIRIIATTGLALTQPVAIVDFSHNVLFRVFLLVTVAGFYGLWLRWAIRHANFVSYEKANIKNNNRKEV